MGSSAKPSSKAANNPTSQPALRPPRHPLTCNLTRKRLIALLILHAPDRGDAVTDPCLRLPGRDSRCLSGPGVIESRKGAIVIVFSDGPGRTVCTASRVNRSGLSSGADPGPPVAHWPYTAVTSRHGIWMVIGVGEVRHLQNLPQRGHVVALGTSGQYLIGPIIASRHVKAAPPGQTGASRKALILYLLSNPLPIPYIGRPAIPLRRHTRCCQEQQAADQHQPQYSPIYYQLNGDIIVLLQGSLLPRHICDWFLELSRKPISWRNRI